MKARAQILVFLIVSVLLFINIRNLAKFFSSDSELTISDKALYCSYAYTDNKGKEVEESCWLCACEELVEAVDKKKANQALYK